jgi:tRNA(fMet)-specific endonuclease VapC
LNGFLLDSNVLIGWLNGMPEAIGLLERLASRPEAIAVNAISIAETYSGLIEADQERALSLLTAFQYWPIDFAVARLAGSYRYEYSRRGRRLTTTDTLLAAHAVARDATLVTANVRDYPMRELRVLRLE